MYFEVPSSEAFLLFFLFVLQMLICVGNFINMASAASDFGNCSYLSMASSCKLHKLISLCI